ncbi:MAG TPA: DUF2975 domain-containing protein [Puia sp.]|uniref:DUF2975 domain-containing protein n=1 Tax=Puia sp. TaxID=2045100 RepID=UPI002BAB83DB|nr:DUF2975 domain-containing protein [Puia sp.]HVU94614.1 DUF2975 domain-containing protein [Puia sp.]
MKITTQQMLKILQVLAWIIFVGVCIEAGGFIVNTFFTLAINPIDAGHFWPGVDLSGLYGWDRGYFIIETVLMCIVAVLRCWIFWLIVKILHDKKLDLYQPFNKEMGRFITRLSWLALLTGLFSWWGAKYAEWFVQRGVKMPELQYLRIGGADVWLFMGVILYVIAQIFKRGIEIQSENELTV